MVVKDIEREDVEFVCKVSQLQLFDQIIAWKVTLILNHLLFIYFFIFFYFQTLNCKPVASLDHFTPEMLGSADLVEEVQTGASKVVKVIKQ